LASGSDDKTILLSDLTNSKDATKLQNPRESAATCLTFSPFDDYLLVGTYNQMIYLSDVATSLKTSYIHMFNENSTSVRDVCFLNNNSFALCNSDSKI
jgi:WD40 repeat protein